MGLSETLPVTSYFKMIDIWMLFTMTVPFLEVVLHTAKEVFKKSKPAHACLSKQVDMVKVKPAEDDQEVVRRSRLATTSLTRSSPSCCPSVQPPLHSSFGQLDSLPLIPMSETHIRR